VNVALAGAHRTGKSTLASAFAQAEGFTYIPSRAGEAFARLGLRVGDAHSMDQRLSVQETILDLHVEDIARHRTGHWISDRSALDMAAYTLLHAAGDRSCDHQRVADYVGRCFDVANRHYAMVVLIQPGIPFETQEGKPPPNPAHQEILNLILFGLFQDPRMDAVTATMRRDVLVLEQRVKAVNHAIEAFLAQEVEGVEEMMLH
jgi:hypothetical protein